MLADELNRIRLTYAKFGDLRFIGHLDLQQLWERALRRSKLPIAYSKGFSPRAKLNLASALPLGISSQCEILDFWLIESLPMDQIKDRITPCLPNGLNISRVECVPLSLPALQAAVSISEFEARPGTTINTADLPGQIEAFMTATSIMRKRRNKPYDLRLLTLTLSILPEHTQPVIFMRLNAKEGATGRPDEVLNQLGYDPIDFDTVRTRIVLE